ncbi:MAG: NADH-quinone oxidoreductase subunit A [Bdellovibrionales bacterium]|nr:NADH-quinone oxidoreductase subunit A [Bdellovibrionales bacterium]
MLDTYLPVLLLLAVATLVPLSMVVVSRLFGPKVFDATKMDAYECGVPAVGEARGSFPVKFHKIAIFFLLLDVEAALLFPWAVIFKDKIGTWGSSFLMFEFIIFLLILLIGYFYAWKRGALEWE